MAYELRSSIGGDRGREPVVLLDVIVEGSSGIFGGHPVHSYIIDLLAQSIGYYKDIYILVAPEIPTHGEVNHEVQGDIRPASIGD